MLVQQHVCSPAPASGVRPNTNTGGRFGTPVEMINFLFQGQALVTSVRQPRMHYLQQTRVAGITYKEVKRVCSRHESIIT